ncbi:MAG TPA: protein kinase [Blastocatellia bacterium]|nr:protein kinase [Blastocatellia bacterium]
MILAANAQLDHYEILAPLGKGGMGEVYRARDTRLNRAVALKVLPESFAQDADRLSRFEQEALATSALNHPNILTVHDFGLHEGSPYLVMELLEGEELRARLQRGALPRSTALEYAEQIAAGLAIAHEKGIVHRDLKPENLFITNDGRVKILDFGLAKLKPQRAEPVGSEAATQKQITSPGTVMGTASYMSPEQARGEKVDARSDLFSLGVVLYEMLAGQRPFAGANMLDVVGAVLHQEPKPLPDAPPELQRIVSQALQKDREQRYQTARDLLTDLKDLKEELAFAAKQARSGQPDKPLTVQAESNLTSHLPTAPTISSAKIILGEIKRHKLAVFITLLILVAAATGIGLYQRQQKTEAPIDSLAVLPFANQNRAEETEYLADGLTESIINNLTQLPNLRVIARNSAFRYKGKEDDHLSAGQALGVRAVVVGRVLQRGDNLMVSAELVDARDNRQIEGWIYNRKLADVFAVQEEIARAISEKLRLKLTGAEQQQLAKRPTENLKAFQYYMQGREGAHRRTREDLFAAVNYCKKAIGEDPNFALAYVGLAEAYAILGVRGNIAHIEGRRKAEEAAQKALALDANLAEAYALLGLIHTTFVPYDFALGDRQLKRAIELSPSLAMVRQNMGVSLARRGRLDESLAEFLKARELDPLSSIIARQVALPYYLKRDYARARELLRQADELGPQLSAVWEIQVYLQDRLFDEALVAVEKAKQERKGEPILIHDAGMVYAAQGKRAEALRIIKELEEMNQAYYIAKIYGTLNEKELALTWLERSLAAGAIGPFYKDEPVWDTIRSDARFQNLLRRMGLLE